MKAYRAADDGRFEESDIEFPKDSLLGMFIGDRDDLIADLTTAELILDKSDKSLAAEVKAGQADIKATITAPTI